jgi:NAD(P)H dehydrogenase (quinone)
MARILVVYQSQSGNTEKMAQRIVAGMKTVKGVEVVLQRVEATGPRDLLDFDAIMLGAPVYYGMPPAEVKDLIDKSVQHHGELKGKLGGAFASSANVGGGNETTVLDILHAWLIHGMLVVGSHEGDHYGPVSIGAPDARANKVCSNYGVLFAETAKRLFG